jgi:hypothetical protein
MKTCTDCKEKKPTSEFNIHESKCKPCKAAWTKENIPYDPERRKRYYRNTWRFKLYGITREQFNSMNTGQCDICAHEFSRAYIDHNNVTGKVRGILCQQCNAALGFFMDDPEIILKAAAYLYERGYNTTEGTNDRVEI